MIGQLSRFASVGIVATLLHVVVALTTRELVQVSAQLANLTGFCAAVGLSYLGHSLFTFKMDTNHSFHLPRFLFISLVGLATSSTITFVVHSRLGGSFWLAMAGVAILVPLLSFLALKYWVFSQSGSGKPNWFPGFSVALAIAAGFLLVFTGRYVNHDVAWYLVATRKWLGGAQLYIDIVEVNPPFNFYLTVPAIWIADLFQISDSNGQYVFVAGLLVISLTWVWHVLGQYDGLSMMRRLTVLTGSGLALIIPAGVNIAQREHMMLIMLLPYLFGYVVLPSPDRGRGAVARSAFAAIGLCIKPHFMLFPMVFTLLRMWQTKSLKPILSPSNLVILLFGLAYIGMVFTLHPAYLSKIVPMAVYVYGAYSFGVWGVFGSLNPVLILLILAYAYVLLTGDRRPQSVGYLFAAILAATASYLLQWTGFSYQLLPVVSLMVIISIWVLVQSNLRTITLFVMGAGLLFVFETGIFNGFYKNWAVAELADRVEAQGPAPRLMVFSTELGIGFPLALDTGAVWTSRYPAMWLIPGPLNSFAREDCVSNSDKCTLLAGILRQTRQDIVSDFEVGHPDILIFDHRGLFLTDKDFDFNRFLSDDPRFEGLLAKYSVDTQTEEYTVWTRSRL